jgi:L-methionine (R)-S-oxide reductase
MAENLIKISGTRAEQYKNLYPQVKSLLAGESDKYANLANVAAAIHDIFGFFWVGFYLVKGDEMVLGPFQGPVACTRIPFHKGVCGRAYSDRKTIIVPNVDEFPGHIACSSASKSEIVVPLIFDNKVIMVLDVDSDCLNNFTEVDQKGLEKLMSLIEENWVSWN